MKDVCEFMLVGEKAWSIRACGKPSVRRLRYRGLKIAVCQSHSAMFPVRKRR